MGTAPQTKDAADATEQPSATPATETLFHKCRARLGFRTNYAFVLWAFFSSFMLLFVYIRAPYLHPSTYEARSSPGEWYWLRKSPYHFGIFLHLYTVIPTGFLSIFQFVPAIRVNATPVHHVIGYLVMLLLTLGNIGVIFISRVSMGGHDLNLYCSIAFLIFSTTGGMYLAWYNIRRKQIDEHRKWMLRSMFWMGIIITMRLIEFVMAISVAYYGKFATLWTCEQAQFVVGNTTALYEEFPACRLGMDTYIGVPADLRSRLHVGSLIRLTFSASVWTAIALHTFGVELYIHLTSRESERLRMVSYHKQRASGLVPPGSAGITADRWGDSVRWSAPKKSTE